MRRKTAQGFLIASGIMLLLGGGLCLTDPLKFGIIGLGALGIAPILFLIGLAGIIFQRRDK
jgi:hypothetical protein